VKRHSGTTALHGKERWRTGGVARDGTTSSASLLAFRLLPCPKDDWRALAMA
jgi:hypothetical protein